jgi:hypothetical protein
MTKSVKNRLKAVKFLVERGFKVQKTKIYRDCKSGLLRVQPDGSILESDLISYATTLQKPGELAETPAGTLLRQKLENEVKKLKEQVRQIQLKNEVTRGKYVEKVAVEQRQAILAGVLKVGLSRMYEAYGRESIDLVGGDLAKTRPFVNFWIEKTSDLLDEFARLDEITVEFVK